MPSKTQTKPAREPFDHLHNQGMILGPDGQKMSKSKGNVINPDEVVAEYGADSLRMYEMFMGPFEDSKPWSVSGIKGVYRFLDKIWKIIESTASNPAKTGSNPQIQAALHDLVESIDSKIPKLQFNTCVSDFMKFINQFGSEIFQEDLKIFLKLIFPFAPIISVEGLSLLGEKDFLEKYYNYQGVWPQLNPQNSSVKQSQTKIMIKNKFRGQIDSTSTLTEQQIMDLVRQDPRFTPHLPAQISKVVYVEGKVLSIV